MNVSKEVRTGLLVSIALVVFFAGFFFLKGTSLFSDERNYYAYFNNIQGLVQSANVELNGLAVGHVAKLDLMPDNKVKVTISVNKGIAMRGGTVASLSSSNILSGKIIRIDLGNGTDVINPEGVIPSHETPPLLEDIGNQVNPIVDNLKATMVSLDSVLRNVNMLLNEQNRQAISSTLASVNTTAASLSKLSEALASQSESMKGIIANTNRITATFAKSDDTITQIINNLSAVSRQLAHAPLQKAISDLQGTVAQLHGIMEKVNNNQGSLGMLVNNKDLYTNMNGTLKSLDQLLADMKEHPSRYINVTIFGKKK